MSKTKKAKGEKPDPMKVSEVRLSLLEADEDGNHSKHVQVTITDPDVCDVIRRAVSSVVDIDAADDAHHYHYPEPKEAKETKEEKKSAAA